MIDSTRKTSRAQAVNVGAQQVAGVYAKALVGAAQKADRLDELVVELRDFLATVLDPFPKFEEVLGSALVAHEEKSQMLDRLFASKLSATMLDFLKVVSRHGRLDVLRAIAGEVERQYDELRGRIRVQLHTATPLADGAAGNLATSLRKLLGGEPDVEASVDPALIGGVVLRVGDTVYDGSVARQLAQVRQQMINRSVHEIQSRRDRVRHSGGN